VQLYKSLKDEYAAKSTPLRFIIAQVQDDFMVMWEHSTTGI